jgi:hypothetical protein
MIVRLQNADQYSSIHNILKATKNEINKVDFLLIYKINIIILFSFIQKKRMTIKMYFFN